MGVITYFIRKMTKDALHNHFTRNRSAILQGAHGPEESVRRGAEMWNCGFGQLIV